MGRRSKRPRASIWFFLKNLTLDPDALAELEEAAAWYEQQRPGLAVVFLREAKAVFTHVRERPRLFSQLALASDLEVRRALLKRFPYAAIFIELTAEVRIIAMAHTKRRESYWLGRLRSLSEG